MSNIAAMNYKKRIVKILAITTLTACLLSGCGSAASSSSYFVTEDSADYSLEGFSRESYVSNDAEAYEYDEAVAESSEGSEQTTIVKSNSQKIIYTAYINIETKKYDDDVTAVKELVEKYGGYLEYSDMSGKAEDGDRYCSFTARIPVDKYDDFMLSTEEVGAVTSKSETAEDVTSNYVDVQARIESLKTKLKKLQELEAQADNMTDLLDIEDRINDTQYQLESYTAQLKTLDSQIEYCTVTINISEVVTYTNSQKESLASRVAEAFRGSLEGFIGFLQNALITLIYLLPYIVILLIIALVVTVLLKRRKNRKLKKQETTRTEQKQEDAES